MLYYIILYYIILYYIILYYIVQTFNYGVYYPIELSKGALPYDIFLYWMVHDYIMWMKAVLNDITNMEWKSSNIELY